MRFNAVMLIVLFASLAIGCNNEDSSDDELIPTVIDPSDNGEVGVETPLYADIDFSHWKVTLPVDANTNGSPDEYPPAVLVDLGYQTLDAVRPYMYDDTTDAALVFYTFPSVATANSSYSRTELRELINPSNSRENWTLAEGGIMEGQLKVDSVSLDGNSNSEYHKTIVMQIHGIISEADMNTHGFSSNNGPPLIKIYWKDGYIWCHKKSLIDENTSGDALLETSNETWTDLKDNLGYVGFEAFHFKITASNARLEVQLNDNAPLVYQDLSLQKWPYENYFKAGNYLGSTDAGAFAYVKYYSLSVTH